MIRSLLGLFVASCVLVPTVRADVPYWQIRNGGFAPFVRTIAVDPTNSDVVYVGVTNAGTPWGEFDNEAGGGVRRSTDGGATWTPRNNGIGNLLVTSLVIDPTNTNVLYAGLDRKGVYRTTDAGASWNPTANVGLTDLDVHALAMDPTTPTTLYAGTDGSGVFRSLDGGATWTLSSGTAGKIFTFAIDPVTPSTVYAGADGGVLRSTDGGASFVPTGKIGTSYGPEVRGLVVDASNPSTVLAAGHGSDSGMWRSTDGGVSWNAASTGLLSEYGNNRHMTTVAQDPLDPAVFYASSLRDNFRSVDGGFTWVKFATGLSRENLPAIAVHADGTVYAGSTFGEFHRLRVRPSGVNHFRCFKASAKGFAPQAVTVTDRFGTASTMALKPFRYCTPTDPMGEGVVDATSHLVCYKLAKVAVEEQFIGFLSQRIDGFRGYVVNKQDSLCVPATVGVPAAAPRDAYRCIGGPKYRSNFTDFSITDAYGTQYARRTKVDRVCGPTDLDGAGENVLEPGVDLRCDSLKDKASFTRTTVTTTDRFGTLTLKLIKPESHCFPALESRL